MVIREPQKPCMSPRSNLRPTKDLKEKGKLIDRGITQSGTGCFFTLILFHFPNIFSFDGIFYISQYFNFTEILQQFYNDNCFDFSF